MTAAATVWKPRIGAAWEPQPGPQTRFSKLACFEALYGGAKGGGKSDSILAEALRYVHIPGYKALLCRQTYGDLEEMMQRAAELYPVLGGRASDGGKLWAFPSGARARFAYVDTFEDACRFDGHEYHYLGFDELGKCKEERTWTRLLSCLRKPPEGAILRARASANPMGAGHAWVKERFIEPCGLDGSTIYRYEIDPERSPGVLVTRAFVPARVTDNLVLMQSDPLYVARLNSLPELERKALRDGDWDVGEGSALPELCELHLIKLKDFELKPHWTKFLSFDWGHAHPFSLGLYCVPQAGQIVKLDTVTGRRMSDAKIAMYCAESLKVRGYDFDDFEYTVAGGDCWTEVKAHVGRAPSAVEVFAEYGWRNLTRAHDKPYTRIPNLSNARRYTAWRGMGPNGEDIVPAFRFVETEGNLACYRQMRAIVCDPDAPEAPLKVDADAEGKNGDDMWDETMYALASRPYATPEPSPHKDPLQHGRDMTEFKPYDEMEQPEAIGELPYGF